MRHHVPLTLIITACGATGALAQASEPKAFGLKTIFIATVGDNDGLAFDEE